MTEIVEVVQPQIPSSIGKWKSYPNYKDSGVEWLGEIPEHWEVTSIKRLAMQGYRTFTDGDWIEAPYITQEGIRLIQTGNVGIGNFKEQGFRYISEETFNAFGCTEVLPGDILICRLADPVGRACAAPKLGFRMITSVDVCILKLKKSFDQSFVVYFLSSPKYLSWMQALCRGATRDRVSRFMLGAIEFLLPPFSEQRAIAALLDRETSKINSLIAKKQRLIKLLQEKRAALISHAVTKGLDPDVKMKDSGVEWLGEIPEHWKMMRVRDVTKLIQTGPFGSQLHSSDYSPNGTPVINPSHLIDGHIQPDWDCAVDEEFRHRLARHILRNGDIVFARRGEMGRCALVTEVEEGWLCGTGSLLVRPDITLSSPSFLNKVLSTRGVKDWLLLESVGSTMDNLNTGILSRIPLPMPPLSEQYTIVAFIDQETAKIDALISKIGEAIEKLKEYSTALISAAVTGKIDVRDVVAIIEDADFSE